MNKLNWIVAFVLAALMSSSPCSGQEWVVTYGGTDYDGAASIQQTTDGGYVVAGHTSSFGAGEVDCWILKLDGSGNVIWQNTYGGISRDSASSIWQTTDGGYVVAGYTSSFGAGNSDCWVLKLDAGGEVTWQKTYSGGGDSVCKAHSIRETTDGGYVVAGDTAPFGQGNFDCWVLKLDGNGNVAWQKTYGGSKSEVANSIQETTDGGYIVAGYTESFGPGYGDYWILKLDDSGNVIWQNTYGGISRDSAGSIWQTTDGGYVVAGETSSFDAGYIDLWVLKLDAGGNIAWQKIYGGNEEDTAGSIRQTTDGGFVVAGTTVDSVTRHRNAWILKLDGSGDVLWQKTYGGSEQDDGVGSIEQTTDGGYVAAGFTCSFGMGNSDVRTDVWVVKMDGNGEIPGCTIMGTSNATVTETSVTNDDTSVTPMDSLASTANTSVSAENTWAGKTLPCGEDSAPGIRRIITKHDAYGTKIKVKGRQFGDQRMGMFDEQEGYVSFVTFSGTQTLIGTKYPGWSDDIFKVRFKKLFVDEDGDFLQDGNEATLPMEQIPRGDYVLAVHTLRFEDLNTNGIYDENDGIIASESSNAVIFTLTDEPVVYALVPNSTPASVPGSVVKVKIRGLNFGDTQGSSLLHIGGRTWSAGHPKITLWRDDAIKFKVPKYDPPFPKYKDVWVTVFDGVGRKTHSNVRRLKIDTYCPYCMY